MHKKPKSWFRGWVLKVYRVWCSQLFVNNCHSFVRHVRQNTEERLDKRRSIWGLYLCSEEATLYKQRSICTCSSHVGAPLSPHSCVVEYKRGKDRGELPPPMEWITKKHWRQSHSSAALLTASAICSLYCCPYIMKPVALKVQHSIFKPINYPACQLEWYRIFFQSNLHVIELNWTQSFDCRT